MPAVPTNKHFQADAPKLAAISSNDITSNCLERKGHTASCSSPLPFLQPM